jgi:hypothetical protein
LPTHCSDALLTDLMTRTLRSEGARTHVQEEFYQYWMGAMPLLWLHEHKEKQAAAPSIAICLDQVRVASCIVHIIDPLYLHDCTCAYLCVAC